MADGYPIEGNGTRVILGMAPAKYDAIACTYDASNNLLTATFSLTRNGVKQDICKITCTYDVNNNLTNASVGAP